MEETRATSQAGTPAGGRWPLYGAIFVLFLLHNDLWLWHDARLVLGLPVGLLYHVVYCLVTSVVLALLVKYAWPSFAESESPSGPGPAAGRGETSPSPESHGEGRDR